MENVVLTTEELKIQDPESYFRDNLEVGEFKGLETLVRDSNKAISWEKLIKEGVVKLEGNKIEGIYWKGDLDLRCTKVKTLWKLKEVGGDLDCTGIEVLEDLGELEEVRGNLSLKRTNIKTLARFKNVGGDLDCQGSKALEDLGELEEVEGNLYLGGTNIKNLSRLEIVGGYLDIGRTRIESLGILKKVGGTLDCRGVETLEDLGELEEIGGNLWLGRIPIKTLGKLRKVWGSILGVQTNLLEDFGNLESVGGMIDVEDLSYGLNIDILNKYLSLELKCGELVINRKLKGMVDRLKLDNGICFTEYRKIFGEDLRQIKDKHLKLLGITVLKNRYKKIKKKLNKDIDYISRENRGKDLVKEEKNNLKAEIKNLIEEFEKQKTRLENFGIELE